MRHSVSIQLDDRVLARLEGVARDRGMSVPDYLGALANEEARRVRRDRIRAQSRALAERIENDPEVREFHEAWSMPTDPGGGN